MQLFLRSIGVLGPGLDGWAATQRVLAGEVPYEAAPPRIVAPDLLPSAERRRAVPSVRLALQVGKEALDGAGVDVADLPTVFSASGGDGTTMHAILDTLAQPAREMSPTQFHNSVHNAPAGYWSIATGSHAPTTSLAAHDSSFAAGLLEAAAQLHARRAPVLLVSYDGAYPGPLNAVRPIIGSFGVALLLAPDHGIARLQVTRERGAEPAGGLGDAKLDELRAGNPAARSLPLLRVLARREAGEVVVPDTAGHVLRIAVTPS